MSTGLIVVIVLVALIIIGALVLLPRMRASADRKKAERELHSRRQAVAGEHREAAAEREQRAERAEQEARMAQQNAERERAEANLRKERASMHERGLADDELIDESERERFEPVTGPTGTRDADADGHTVDDRARAATDRDAERTTPATADGETRTTRADGTTADYEQGREDERRFDRDRVTDDVRESDRRS